MHTETNISIKAAASRLGLKYENAKAIVKVYRKENWTKQLMNHPFIRHKTKRLSTTNPNTIYLQEQEELKFPEASQDAVWLTQHSLMVLDSFE